MNVTHSPLPWKHYAEDNIICPSNGTGRILEWTPRSANVSVAERDANADFIVKAVNAHDSLLASLKALYGVLDAFGDMPDGLIAPSAWKGYQAEEKLEAARAALASAGEQV